MGWVKQSCNFCGGKGHHNSPRRTGKEKTEEDKGRAAVHACPSKDSYEEALFPHGLHKGVNKLLNKVHHDVESMVDGGIQDLLKGEYSELSYQQPDGVFELCWTSRDTWMRHIMFQNLKYDRKYKFRKFNTHNREDEETRIAFETLLA